MGRALGLVASRVFGSRYGIALLLAIVVLAIVGTAKLFAGSAGVGGSLTGGNGTTISPVPSGAAADDGESTPVPTPTLVTTVGAAPPEAVATAFAAAWVNHRDVNAGQWLARLRPHATPALTTRLTGADPDGVPADRVTGAVKLVPRSEVFAEATLPVDSGTLRLRLVAVNGHWFVDGVDWERA